MAKKEELAAELAGAFADAVAHKFYGSKGPALDCDIDEMEDLAVLAARAAFDAVLAKALWLQSQQLPEELPCPDCQTPCRVKYEERTIQGRMASARIKEPFGHCPACERDFFPPAGSPAAG